MRIYEALTEPNLALVATHGNPEIVGEKLHESDQKQPITGWDVEIANQLAHEHKVRQVKHNLAVAYGQAAVNAAHRDYELRRPHQILQLAASRNIVLDIHDAPLDNRADFVEIGQHGDPRLLGIAALLGIKNVVIGKSTKTLTGNNPRAMLIELGRGERGELVAANVERLRECMGKVATGDMLAVSTDEFNYYQRVTEIKTAKAQALGLPELAVIEPFEAVPEKVLYRLRGSDGAVLPMGSYAVEYWNGQSSAPREWFGSIFKRVQNPFIRDGRAIIVNAASMRPQSGSHSR